MEGVEIKEDIRIIRLYIFILVLGIKKLIIINNRLKIIKMIVFIFKGFRIWKICKGTCLNIL